MRTYLWMAQRVFLTVDKTVTRYCCSDGIDEPESADRAPRRLALADAAALPAQRRRRRGARQLFHTSKITN